MKAIDKAWQENLQEPKDHQWKSKEEIIENLCPYDYRLKSSPNCNDGEDNEICVKCWNREIEEDDTETHNKSESTFEALKICPTNINICINECSEDTFIKAVKDNDIIVYIEENTDIYYDDIPKIINWLQDVYNCSTELKNKIEYVDWNTAKEYMEISSRKTTKYKDYEYYIKNNELHRADDDGICTLTLEAINSKEWILL